MIDEKKFDLRSCSFMMKRFLAWYVSIETSKMWVDCRTLGDEQNNRESLVKPISEVKCPQKNCSYTRHHQNGTISRGPNKQQMYGNVEGFLLDSAFFGNIMTPAACGPWLFKWLDDNWWMEGKTLDFWTTITCNSYCIVEFKSHPIRFLQFILQFVPKSPASTWKSPHQIIWGESNRQQK